MKKVAILQSNYIPWKGYFDLIAAVDEFILYDEMQYTRRDWRNRNQIKTPQGLQWLTVPVQVKGRFNQRICDTQIDGTGWAAQHWKSIAQNYQRAAHFDEIALWLEPIYRRGDEFQRLSQLNAVFIRELTEYLGITTTISWSTDYTLEGNRSECLANLCRQAGGDEYLSGPAAKDYIDETAFSNRNIKMTWFDYDGYPEYAQLTGEFTHFVSIIDLLFNCGPDARNYMRYVT